MNVTQNKKDGVLTVRPELIQFFINELPMIILAPVLFYIWLAYPFWGSNAVLFIGIVLVCLLMYRFLYLRSIVYTISSQQLLYSHGVFTNSTEYIELYRIIDYQEYRSLMQQLMGLKTVTIVSTDRTTPMLRIKGLRISTDLIPTLRRLSEINKKRMGVYEIANR